MLLSLAVGGTAQQPAPGDAPQTSSKGFGKVKAPVPLYTPDAEMPDAAGRAQQSGVCVISLIVDAQGKPKNPRVVRCTDPIFNGSSLKAVMKYRFDPARRLADGTAVPVTITVTINFNVSGRSTGEPPATIGYSFHSPPGTTFTAPDATGVYPLSKQLEQPKMVDFVSKGFAQAALTLPHGTGCDLVLVIDAKGKAESATVSKCDKPVLERPAVESMMKSKFKPAKLNGQAVAVRLRIHLVYEGFGTGEAAAAGKH